MILPTYQITQAKDGGYIVTREGGEDCLYRLLFAGTLTDALEYIEQKLDRTQK
jgi:hypothetical protein